MDEPELRVTKLKAQYLIPRELIDDYTAMDDLLGKALRGEIELRPPAPPRRHRCVLCWLLARLPGHDRCEHGRMACDDCYSDY